MKEHKVYAFVWFIYETEFIILFVFSSQSSAWMIKIEFVGISFLVHYLDVFFFWFFIVINLKLFYFCFVLYCHHRCKFHTCFKYIDIWYKKLYPDKSFVQIFYMEFFFLSFFFFFVFQMARKHLQTSLVRSSMFSIFILYIEYSLSHSIR